MPSFQGALTVSRLGDCPRRLAYILLSGEQREPEVNPVFLEGHWHEFEVKQRISPWVTWEAGICDEAYVAWEVTPDWTIRGHLDAIGTVSASSGMPYLPQRGGRYLIEIKSMGPGTYWQFVKKGIPAYYYAQIQGYMSSALKGVQDTKERAGEDQIGLLAAYGALRVVRNPLLNHVPDCCLFLVKNRDTGDIRSTVADHDPYCVADLRARWKAAEERIQDSQPPDRLYADGTSAECKRCPFKDQCWEDDVPRPVERVITNPLIDDAVDQYVVGKVLVGQGNQLVTDARNRLDCNLTEGVYRTANAKVRKYTRRTKKTSPEEAPTVSENTVVLVDADQELRDVIERTVGEWSARRN